MDNFLAGLAGAMACVRTRTRRMSCANEAFPGDLVISAVRTHRPSQPLWRLCHIPKPYAVPPLEKEE